MRPNAILKHEFVEFIPEELEQGTLYISIRFATGVALVLLRMRQHSRYANPPHGLEAHF